MYVRYDPKNSEIISMSDITYIHFYLMKYVTNYKIYIKVNAGYGNRITEEAELISEPTKG
jgi:hypothetical protein